VSSPLRSTDAMEEGVYRQPGQTPRSSPTWLGSKLDRRKDGGKSQWGQGTFSLQQMEEDHSTNPVFKMLIPI